MISNRHIAKITAALVVFAVFVCGAMVYAANNYDITKVTQYQKKLFADEVVSIDIRVDEAEWQNLLDNAADKVYVSGDLFIDGVKFSSVGIRTKGNSSLTQVAGSDSDRYSLEFRFDYYIKGQTCYGLDSMCVNNLMGDATYMKDYISYDIMKYIGVDAPLVNYAEVSVNGEAFGFYLLLERYDKSFLDRVYDTSAGQLYNVKIQMGQRDNFMNGNNGNNAGNNQNFEFRDFQAPPEDGNFTMPEIGAGNNAGGRGGMGNQSGGGSLVYTDDEISSYGAIFDNAIFSNSCSDKDKQKVITAIKNLNAGTNLEEYFNIDEILRYLAAHTVVVNLDSYSSSMQQNYYIYERDGKITILPWDYGLAFGGFQSGNASAIVNFAIDTPVSGVNLEDRPLIGKLLEIDKYKEKYHEYLREIADGYFNGGVFENTVLSVDKKINSYVKSDVSAFYTYEQYEESLPVLIKLGELRAQSITGQLDGSIPSTTSGQNADGGSLVDASEINISALGTMMGGGGQFGRNNTNMPEGFFGGGGNTRDRNSGGRRNNNGGGADSPGNMPPDMSGGPPEGIFFDETR